MWIISLSLGFQNPLCPLFSPCAAGFSVATSWQTIASLLPADVDWRFDLEFFADGSLQNPGQLGIQTFKVRKSQELQRPMQYKKMILESHNCKFTKYNTDAVKVFLATSDETWNITQCWLPELSNLKFTLCFKHWMQRTCRKVVRTCQILNLELACDVLKLEQYIWLSPLWYQIDVTDL